MAFVLGFEHGCFPADTELKPYHLSRAYRTGIALTATTTSLPVPGHASKLPPTCIGSDMPVTAQGAKA